LREALAHWPLPEIADLPARPDRVDRALLFRARYARKRKPL